MIKRYEVRWKTGGGNYERRPVNESFFTFGGAMRSASRLNRVGFEFKLNSIAVVWDRKLNEQVSIGLY